MRSAHTLALAIGISVAPIGGAVGEEEAAMPTVIEANRTTLEGFSHRATWVSYMGSLESCARYLDPDLSPSWLWGGCGYAFSLTVHEGLCPSGPYMPVGRFDHLVPNLGLTIEDMAEIIGQGEQGLLSFYGAESLEDLVAPEYEAYRQSVDMLELMSPDDPPFWAKSDIENPRDSRRRGRATSPRPAHRRPDG